MDVKSLTACEFVDHLRVVFVLGEFLSMTSFSQWCLVHRHPDPRHLVGEEHECDVHIRKIMYARTW